MKSSKDFSGGGAITKKYSHGEMSPATTAKKGQSDDGVNYMSDKGTVLTQQSTVDKPVSKPAGKKEKPDMGFLNKANDRREFYQF